MIATKKSIEMAKSSKPGAQNYANQAMDLMAQHIVPPTPQNYQLWYTYASGEAPALNRMIDSCLDKMPRIGEDLSARLYAKFFGAAAEVSAVQETGQQMHAELEKVITRLRTAETDTSNFGNVLMGYSDDLAEVKDAGSLKTFVSGLARETREMESKTRSLEAELKKSSEEINRLKSNLDVARAEALTDQLTGIGNRKQFDCVLKMNTEDAIQAHRPLSLIFSDVDHFKNFNDTWGHKLGDHVLKLVAQQMKMVVNDRGTPTRYGGEEFAILLPDTSLPEALSIAETLRLTISKKQMKTKATGVSLGRITMSFGVAQYIAGEVTDAFVERADNALYAAKEAGRNRVMAEEHNKIRVTS